MDKKASETIRSVGPDKPKVVITVRGGVAEVEKNANEVDVLFFDYDDLDEMDLDEARALLSRVEAFDAPEFTETLEALTDELKDHIASLELEGDGTRERDPGNED